MRPRAWWWGLLAVAVASTSGCTSALSGAVIGVSPSQSATVTVASVPSSGPGHQFGGKSNLLPNGSFSAGTSPWLTMDATLVWTKKPHRFGKTALLVRPTSFKPFGARVEIAATPAAHTVYSLSAWVRGNHGSDVVVQLYRNKPRSGKAIVIGTTENVLTGRWQHLSVRGQVVRAGPAYVSGAIYVYNRVSLTSWLAIDGVKATQTSGRPGK